MWPITPPFSSYPVHGRYVSFVGIGCPSRTRRKAPLSSARPPGETGDCIFDMAYTITSALSYLYYLLCYDFGMA